MFRTVYFRTKGWGNGVGEKLLYSLEVLSRELKLEVISNILELYLGRKTSLVCDISKSGKHFLVILNILETPCVDSVLLIPFYVVGHFCWHL